MRTTIDKAGRVVIPKEMRERIGLRPGEVDVHVDGAGLRIEPVSGEPLLSRAGRVVVAAAGVRLDDDDVRALRNADQR
jgi:AbrB family looped-hinge helix DNA binding protein